MSGWVWPGVSPLLVMASPGVRGRRDEAHAQSRTEPRTKLIFACRLVRIGPGPSRQFSHVHMEIQARAEVGSPTGRPGAHWRTATGMDARGVK